MLVNSSSSNDSPISFFFFDSIRCFISRPSSFIFTIYIITNMFLLLPLCILILHHGLQQWRQKHSTSSAMTSHSDSFTYHMVVVELVGVFGWILCCSAVHIVDLYLLVVGFLITSFCWYIQMFFHVLTCVERYIAVIHPITYLNLRNERGIRIRNVSIGCSWLLSFTGVGLVIKGKFVIVNFCILLLAIIVVFLLSFAVLSALIRPGPGERSNGRGRVDQSKQRALFTIVTILGVLVLRFIGSLIWNLMFASETGNNCLIMASVACLNIPISLVLPLLFLHRVGKLVCCRSNIQ